MALWHNFVTLPSFPCHFNGKCNPVPFAPLPGSCRGHWRDIPNAALLTKTSATKILSPHAPIASIMGPFWITWGKFEANFAANVNWDRNKCMHAIWDIKGFYPKQWLRAQHHKNSFCFASHIDLAKLPGISLLIQQLLSFWTSLSSQEKRATRRCRYPIADLCKSWYHHELKPPCKSCNKCRVANSWIRSQ